MLLGGHLEFLKNKISSIKWRQSNLEMIPTRTFEVGSLLYFPDFFIKTIKKQNGVYFIVQNIF
jgi:hypothetical protein